jgi:hypothetical protein
MITWEDGELVMPRDTRTGGVLENMILPALERGGYQHRKLVIGTRLGGRSQKVDVLAWRVESEQLPISLKWQQTSGTAEQNVPFEVLCLAEAVHKSRGIFKKAYLVLGGNGWTLREFYVRGQIREYLKNCEVVEIVSLETFVARANQSEL